MNEKQQICINLMIMTNKTQKQIAKEINVSEKTICEWKKDVKFKNEISRQMKENFSSLAIEAQKKLGDLLKSKNEFVRMQVAKDILDRAGYKPKEKVEIEKSNNEIAEEIDDYVSKRVKK